MKHKNTLYLECYAGISGDMTVAALLDLGADEKVLFDALKSLPLSGYEIKISRVLKSGIDACDFNVILDAIHETHDHDMTYLHGEDSAHVQKHTHDQIQEYSQEHTHEHIHDQMQEHHHEHSHEHAHNHRGMKEIQEIIEKGELTEHARKLALQIFEILAAAEAKAHNKSIEEVHFHEVGAVDSIIDIVAVAVCLDNLNIGEVVVSKLYEGTGTIRCQHGILPIPVPAVANMVQAHQLPLEITDTKGEFVTPTGAAIVAAIRTTGNLPDTFVIDKIGIGAGKREYERPSMLRAMLIHEETGSESDRIYKLESNLDDCSGEVLSYTMEQLFLAGARDVHYTPVFMKKNRPGWMLSVICNQEVVGKMEQIIFKETSTIGIRKLAMDRSVLKREIVSVGTPVGEVSVKICSFGDEKKYYPEYESVKRISQEQNLPFQEVFDMARNVCKEKK